MYLNDERIQQSHWHNLLGTEIWVKTMKYQNSCFPCSLHTILANLVQQKRNADIEDAWNSALLATSAPGLNSAAPTMEFIVDTLALEREMLENRGIGMRIFTPTDFSERNIQESTATIMETFLNHDKVGIISAIVSNNSGHAVVTMKLSDNDFFHYHPSVFPKDACLIKSELPGFSGNQEAKGIVIYGLGVGDDKSVEWKTGADFVIMLYSEVGR